jgi:hypothetical protein
VLQQPKKEKPMGTNKVQPTSIGTYPMTQAFQIVRDLEHAGIRTEMRSKAPMQMTSYDITVAATDADRALALV